MYPQLEELCLCQNYEKCDEERDEVGRGLGVNEPIDAERCAVLVQVKRSATEYYGYCPVGDRNEAVRLEQMQPGKVGPQVQYPRQQELIGNQEYKQVILIGAVAHCCTDAETDDGIHDAEQKFQHNDVGEIFLQQVAVLRDIAVVEIGDAEIEDDIEDNAEAEQRRIQSVFVRPDDILYRTVDAEYPERLDQQVDEQQKRQIGYKSFFHRSPNLPQSYESISVSSGLCRYISAPHRRFTGANRAFS